MESILNDPEAKITSPELNVAYRMSTEEYYELTPYAKDLEENWGSPLETSTLTVRTLSSTATVRNVFIGVQPSFDTKVTQCVFSC
jgi:magnesium chelatase subunit H